MFYILFTSFNYLHFQINFFPASTLPAFLCCTPYSIRSGHKAELLLFSSLAMENTRSHNILTDYSPAELQSQAGALMHYCYLQVSNSWARSYNGGKQCKYWEQNNETFVPSSRSKAKTTAQQPPFFWRGANKMNVFSFSPMSSQNVHKNHPFNYCRDPYNLDALSKEQQQWGVDEGEEQEHSLLTAVHSAIPAHAEEAAV